MGGMPAPRLWTPIANALEAYRRRANVAPQAEYEHLWRLIHIQEALVVSLAALMATRLFHVLGEDSQPTVLNALRAAITGVQPNTMDPDDEKEIRNWAWQGKIDSWIALLSRFGMPAAVPDDPFLAPLAEYLSSTPNRPLVFAEAWSRIVDVSRTFRDPGLNRVDRFFAINSFRNKLAHVPVPPLLVADLYDGLRKEVLDNLSERFDPAAGAALASVRNPLAGLLYSGRTYVTGSNEVGMDPSRNAHISSVHASYGKGAGAVTWPVEPFVLMNVEAKVALLFRVTDLETKAAGYSGEYHRFAAELEPVKADAHVR